MALCWLLARAVGLDGVLCVCAYPAVQYIDPTFWWENFSEAEQNAILKSGRSNNTLCTDKLEDALPDVRITPAKEAIVGVFQRMRANLKAAGTMPEPRGPRPAPLAEAL